jgi:hypothetical protein
MQRQVKSASVFKNYLHSAVGDRYSGPLYKARKYDITINIFLILNT